MVSPSDDETDEYWEQITEETNTPKITIVVCDGDVTGTVDEKTVSDIFERISETENRSTVIDLSEVKKITPSFIKAINSGIAPGMKIILVVPNSLLRLDLASHLSSGVTVCKSVEQAKNELAEVDIDEIKKRLRRAYYNR